MTSTVFVHGVPETARVWDKVRAVIDRDSVALSLPGFGVPRPAGFDASMDTYADWLRSELAALDGPVDVVGHDWGGILTARLVTTGFPVRSWVSDAIGILDPSYVWHDFAQLWQTPGAGEEFWAAVQASAADSAVTFQAIGVPEEDALPMAEAIDETMTAAILDLYRSATDIGAEWGAGATMPTAPGLVIAGGNDAFVSADGARRAAAKWGAQIEVLDGASHWWPMDSPDEAAKALQSFWSGLPT